MCLFVGVLIDIDSLVEILKNIYKKKKKLGSEMEIYI